MLGFSYDKLMAAHWATITRDKTKDVEAWNDSVKLKNELYQSLCNQFNWSYSDKHEKDAKKIMSFETILKPAYVGNDEKDSKIKIDPKPDLFGEQEAHQSCR